MELLQLRYFCDAAKTENFSATAKKFTVPTSGVSQSIKRLEKELGVELFEHRANKIVLCDAGKQFYQKIVQALSLLDEAKTEITESDNIFGEISLIILCNRRLVTAAIEKFKKAYPQVSFVLKHENDAGHDCDVLISDICPEGFYQAGLLTNEDILLALSKDHALAHKNDISVSDLKNERFISMPKGRSLYSITSQLCRNSGFSPNITIQTDDPHYIRKYVELGLGVAFIPSCSWEGLFSEGTVLKKIGNHTRKTYVCLSQKKKIKPSVEAFLSYLEI